jgi:hypothetical protein
MAETPPSGTMKRCAAELDLSSTRRSGWNL